MNGRSCSDSVFIPESVVKEDVTYPVTSIDNNAFLGSGITTIIIPDSVSTIGDNAFKDCVSLRIVGIGKSVISIGAAAFAGCYRIVSVTIPDSVVEIGTEAFQNCEGITSVIFGFSVFRIGRAAFAGCRNLKSVSIPNTLTSISSSLFEGCSGLASITIPDAVITIHEYAFADCINLKSITIPSSVETICDYAFSDCISLNEVIISDKAAWCKISFGIDSNPLHYANRLLFKYNGIIREINRLDIPDTVKSISAGAFSKCTNITSVYFQSTDVEIKENAFTGCTGINLIDFGNTVTSIGDSAFSSCTGLKSLTIGEQVKSIGEKAFGNCINLKSVTIYPSVTSIGNFAFSGCSSLDKVSIYDLNAWCNIDFGMDANPLRYGASLLHIQNLKPTLVTDLSLFAGLSYIGKRAFQGYKRLKSVIIPDTVTSIGESAFAECEGLSEVTIGRAVLSIGNEAFAGCRGITKVTIPSIWVWCNIDFNGIHSNPLEYGRELYLGDSKITDLRIPSNLSQIKPRAFYNCRSIKSVTIPRSITSIGEDAFFQCCGLEEVCISDIAKWCSIDFEYSGQGDIESNPLIYAHRLHLKNSDEDEMITDLVIPEGVEQINKGTFCGYSALISVTLPDTLTSIGEYAFCDCSNLASAFIPKSVSKIDDHAFDGCSNMLVLSIPKSVESIGKFAFYGCVSLLSVSIFDLNAWCGIDFQGAKSNPLEYTRNLSLENDEEHTSTNITELVISGNIDKINSRAFYGCRFLTSVTIGNSVKTIGCNVFSECANLATVTIESSVKSIEQNAFEGCSALKSLTIGESVTSIGNFAFSRCIGLTWVEIPDSVNTLGNNVFEGCGKLVSVTFGKSVESIGDDAFNGCSNLSRVLISEVRPWFKIKFGNPKSNPLTYSHRLILCDEEMCCLIDDIKTPENVIEINQYLFQGLSGLKSVEIGPAITKISSDAFKGCGKLEKVIIDDIASFCNIDFEGSYSNPLELAHWMFKIGDNNEPTQITDVTIPKGVSAIQPGMFAECYSLIKLTIPDYTSVNTDKDSNADNPIPEEGSESVSIIGENAFLNCYELTEVTIGNSVRTIEAGAFQGCAKLGKLTIGKSVMKIGYGAFFNCAMTSVTIPESVMRIEGLAFYCDKLAEIRCLNRFPIPISENVFKNYDATLEVPSGSKKFYSEDEIWGKFKNIKEPPSGGDTTGGDTTPLVDSQP